MTTIFFDIDGTLVDYPGAERAAARVLYRDHGAGLDGGEDAFLRRWSEVTERHFQRFLMGELSQFEQRRARVQEIFGVPENLADTGMDHVFDSYLHAFQTGWQLYPDVLACLGRLAGQSTLGIISNGDSRQQRSKLSTLKIDHYFEHVLISGDRGVAKPAAAIFQAACAMAGQSPGNCLYVGDNHAVDVIGSAGAGLVPLWLNRLDDGKAQGGAATIYTLDELDRSVFSSL